MKATETKEQETKVRPMTPHEVNTLLMDMMGVPKKAQKDYRLANRLA
jgi:hypothetical protein